MLAGISRAQDSCSSLAFARMHCDAADVCIVTAEIKLGTKKDM